MTTHSTRFRFDPAQVESYLKARLGRSVRLAELSRVPMGLSRETWIAKLDDRKLVLRCDLPGGASSCPASLQFEYDVYRLLNDTPVPTARALWFESDPAPLGQAFYVREYVEGSTSVANFADPDPRYDDVRIAVSKEHARKMALVHTLDWRSLGFDEIMTAPPDAESCASATIDRIEQQLNSIDPEPSPFMAEAFSWMREHAPRTAPCIALCKGSNGDMQEVWADGQIVAMSDWELASLGDPANDWGRCMGYVAELGSRWNMERLLDYYEEVSGIRIDPSTIDYYRLVYGLEMILVGRHAMLPVLDGSLPDVRLAYLSSVPVHMFQARLGEAMGIRVNDG